MDRDDFEIIADAAMSQFDEHHIGLQALLSAGDDLKKYFEQSWRIADYKKTGDFFISQNERNFHLIGFMDALAWLDEQGYLNLPPEDDNSDEEPWVQELLAAGTTYSALVRRILKTPEFPHGEEKAVGERKMPDYKKLYLGLFRATEKAINILVEAQQSAEEQYLSSPEAAMSVLSEAISHTSDNTSDKDEVKIV